MTTQEQKYASAIYEKVVAYSREHPEGSTQRKRYGSMAHRLPILVRQAGLAQALAFVESRKNKSPLLKHLAETVGEESAESLLAHSREASLEAYIYLTNQTMLALKWYKRFTQSVLKIEPTDEAEGDDDA